MASSEKLSCLIAGVNTARREAYRQMLARGFRAELLGVAMEKPNEAGYNRPGIISLTIGASERHLFASSKLVIVGLPSIQKQRPKQI